ncbi:hypothetical protein AAMO2058_000709000 [Amorphochlora amoebiformis]|mmetsp:Transcript_4834/g.7381  ORF Transcript_4834/g.7381 Transcript_4834/m.7381 type:complete len:286 (-) Transcript_4834:218-1075(-)
MSRGELRQGSISLTVDRDGPRRDLGKAKKAYEAKDHKLSIQAHTNVLKRSLEKHSKISDYMKSIVYGGLDGIITTFAVVSGAAGGGFGIDVILVLGFANMFADALSMGMGDALSTKAANAAALKERDRELWELENYPEGEIEEMVEIYVGKGMSEKDARLVVETMVKYKDFFVDQMMVDELGLMPPDEDENPWFDGLVTFTSFVFFGLFPLLAYLFTIGSDLDRTELFGVSIALTGVMLFILGAIKSQFTLQSWWASGTEILALGGFTAAISFLIGWAVESIISS